MLIKLLLFHTIGYHIIAHINCIYNLIVIIEAFRNK